MTDTLVLKNKLVMPQQGTYLELDQDEMEYVDGGWKYIESKWLFLFALGIYLDPSDCRKLASGSEVIGLGTAFIPGPGLIISGVSNVMRRLWEGGANNRGANFWVIGTLPYLYGVPITQY